MVFERRDEGEIYKRLKVLIVKVSSSKIRVQMHFVCLTFFRDVLQRERKQTDNVGKDELDLKGFWQMIILRFKYASPELL